MQTMKMTPGAPPRNNTRRRRALIGILGGAVLALTVGAAPTASGKLATTFENPLAVNGADPYVVRYQGYYYLTMTTGDNVTIWRARWLTELGSGPGRVVWSPGTGNLADVWSPELHQIGGRWYVYFAADQAGNNATHRIYVLQSAGQSPLGPYRFQGMVHDRANQWAIDPTVLAYRGRRYLIWSGWLGPKNHVQHLMIDRLLSPTRLAPTASMLTTPVYPWETSVAPINEGPVVLRHGGRLFIVYSANASWTDQYCLGLMTLMGTNPLRPQAWKKTPHPVFQSANGIYGPGHASFTTSENGRQWWIIYHAAAYRGSGWTRVIRAQPFTWSPRGFPQFHAPVPADAALALPAGEPPTRTTYGPSARGTNDIVFRVRARAGTYMLWVRYRNTSGATTSQSWMVNGAYEPALTYLPTNGRDSSFAITQVTLRAGVNDLRFLEAGAGVSARIAWIQLASG